jgi:RNA polymerase sigma-70 factor (ECF subfamily)
MNRPEPDTKATPTPAVGGFAPTRWTLVRRACDPSSESQLALAELCEAYYGPVFGFIRRSGRSEDAARDLTQGFFAKLLSAHRLRPVEPGAARFRSYLLGMVKHFLADERDRACAAKRGGGHAPVSIEAGAIGDTASELSIPDPAAPVTDALFDRHWATTLVDRAVAALGDESVRDGKGRPFAVLKPWLVGEVPALSQADAARELGLSEGAVKVAVHRLRQRFRALVKQEIAQTVDHPGQVGEELRYLVEVLAQVPVPGSVDTPGTESEREDHERER